MIDTLIIDGMFYSLELTKQVPNQIATCEHSIENIWGLEGLEALKRSNHYGDPCGYVGNTLIAVEEDKITFNSINEKHFNDTIEDVVRQIHLAYPSVGWELLEQDK